MLACLFCLFFVHKYFICENILWISFENIARINFYHCSFHFGSSFITIQIAQKIMIYFSLEMTSFLQVDFGRRFLHHILAISLKGLQKNQFNLWGQILRVTRQCQVHWSSMLPLKLLGEIWGSVYRKQKSKYMYPHIYRKIYCRILPLFK